MRVLIAIEPALPVAEELILLQEDLEDPFRLLGAEVGWTAPYSLHLVLATARVDEQQLQELGDRLREHLAGLAPCTFETRGAFFVPDTDTPRLLAVGTGTGADALQAYHEAARRSLLEVGAAPDDGEWQPWLQVARLATTAETNPLGATITGWQERSFGTTQVRSVLVSSIRRAGPRLQTTLHDRIVPGE